MIQVGPTPGATPPEYGKTPPTEGKAGPSAPSKLNVTDKTGEASPTREPTPLPSTPPATMSQLGKSLNPELHKIAAAIVLQNIQIPGESND